MEDAFTILPVEIWMYMIKVDKSSEAWRLLFVIRGLIEYTKSMYIPRTLGVLSSSGEFNSEAFLSGKYLSECILDKRTSIKNIIDTAIQSKKIHVRVRDLHYFPKRNKNG